MEWWALIPFFDEVDVAASHSSFVGVDLKELINVLKNAGCHLILSFQTKSVSVNSFGRKMNLHCQRIDFGFRLLPSYSPHYERMILAGMVFTEYSF